MAQFDVFRLRTGSVVVDLQTDLIGIKASRIVAPLREAGHYAAFPGLTPEVEIEGASATCGASRRFCSPQDDLCRSVLSWPGYGCNRFARAVSGQYLLHEAL